MNVFIYETKAAACLAAARRVARFVGQKPDATLGLATGNTMIDMYGQLAALHKAGEVSFAKARSFNLDEYVGLPAGHHASYAYFMEKNLFSMVDFAPGRAVLPRGVDDEAAAREYDALIEAAGGIDLQVLGIGRNGHIGFNEPGTPAHYTTHIVTLTQSTKEANAFDFPSVNDVPDKAVTMGLKTILEARHIMLLAFGAGKAEIVKRALTGEATGAVPASLLQGHPDAVFILDAEAAAQL